MHDVLVSLITFLLNQQDLFQLQYGWSKIKSRMKKLYCTFLTYFSIWNQSFLDCTAYGTPCIFLPEDSRNSKTRLPFSSQAKRRSINARALSLAKVQDVIGIKKILFAYVYCLITRSPGITVHKLLIRPAEQKGVV